MKRAVAWTTMALGLWMGGAFAEPGLTVRGAWIPEAPPAAKVQAAYMDLINEGPRPVVVVGAESPDFARIEMHRTVETQGVVRMAAQPRLRVEPGATLVLAPGGLHLMLIEPKRRLVAGDRVEIGLRVEDAASITLTAEVRRDAAPAAAHEHHHH